MKALAVVTLSLLPGAGFVALRSGGGSEPVPVAQPVPSSASPAPPVEHLATRIYVEILPQSLELYVRDSDAIVRGVVTGQRPVFPQRGIAYTEVDLWVLSAAKGRDRRMIQVRVGGAHDEARRVDVIGAPRFVEGEEVLLFLMRFTDGETEGEYWGIRGLGEGAYRMPIAGEGPPTVVGRHASGERDLAAFENRVRDLASRLGAKEVK